MRSKPWPIVILALANLIMPFVNMIISASLQKLPFFTYLARLFTEHPDRAFHMIVPMALSAWAIYAFRKWSYPVLLACMVWILWRNVFNYQNFTGIFNLWILVLALLMNVTIVSYFLFIPAVRAPYFDARLRWWESKPRFRAEAPIVINVGESRVDADLTDISEGGLFMVSHKKIPENEVLQLSFHLEGITVVAQAKAVWHRRSEKGEGYGLCFEYTHDATLSLRLLTDELSRKGYAETRPKIHWREDFKNWWKRLISSGSGLVPELPQNYQAPAFFSNRSKVRPASANAGPTGSIRNEDQKGA